MKKHSRLKKRWGPGGNDGLVSGIEYAVFLTSSIFMCLASCVAAPGAIMRQVAATIEAVKSATRIKTSLHRHSALVVRAAFPDVQLPIVCAPSFGNCRPEPTRPASIL